MTVNEFCSVCKPLGYVIQYRFPLKNAKWEFSCWKIYYTSKIYEYKNIAENALESIPKIEEYEYRIYPVFILNDCESYQGGQGAGLKNQ